MLAISFAWEQEQQIWQPERRAGMTFARKRPVLACPWGGRENPIGRALPSPCWRDRCGFLLLQCDSILGNFARSISLCLCLSVRVCVCVSLLIHLVLPTPPILILLGCHAAGCRGIIVSWAAWPLWALAERACKLGRAGWGREGCCLVWLPRSSPPRWLLINQASRELGECSGDQIVESVQVRRSSTGN
ncbi:hypothetical protein GGI42DRAFT_87443 [Trichoderma sp. SZMC 28013]